MNMFAPPDMPEPSAAPFEIHLVRDLFIDSRNGLRGRTFGKLYLGSPKSDHVCETFEGEDRRLEESKSMRESVVDTAIPCGRYRVTLINSRQNGQVPCLHAVNGFKGVEIIKDRSNQRSPGCIVVGEARNIAGVSMSVLPHNRLVALLRSKSMAGVPVYLTVQRAE
jgi:hypothetical protein